MLLFCWMFSAAGPYYMGIVLVPFVGTSLIVLLLAWPALRDTDRGFRRSTLIVIVLLTCASILFIEFPLSIRFVLSLPAINQMRRDVQTSGVTRGPLPRRAGLFQIGSFDHSRLDGRWSFYESGSSEIGFVYSSTPMLGYPGSNPGSGGHLVGGWYWFSDD